MTDRRRRKGRFPAVLLSAVLVLNIVLIGALVFILLQFRDGLVVANDRGEQSLEMVLGTYTLRQSSDYLTRFARRYAVTGDPAWRDVYQQVLDIRRGDALRPKDYESVYWDLIEPYRSNAHPLLYPQSLRSILEGLPFTAEELALLQEAEDNSEALARLEMAAFDAVRQGRRDQAIEALFSIDYTREKHRIMQPIDQLMLLVRQRIEHERETALMQNERVTQLALAGAGVVLLMNLFGLLRVRRRASATDRPPPEENEQPSADSPTTPDAAP